jgi:hypothetical protein
MVQILGDGLEQAKKAFFCGLVNYVCMMQIWTTFWMLMC